MIRIESKGRWYYCERLIQAARLWGVSLMLSIVSRSRNEVPEACWSKDKEKQKTARTSFKRIQSRQLTGNGRTIESSRWRDDGLAIDWKRIGSAPISTSTKNRKTMNGDVETSSDIAAIDDPSANELHVPYPAEFADHADRSNGNNSFNDWKLEQELVASKLDRLGRRSLFVTTLLDTDGIKMSTSPLNAALASAFPRIDPNLHAAFEIKETMKWPKTTEFSSTNGPAAKRFEFLNSECTKRCLPDEDGRATLFVGCHTSSKKISFIGRTSQEWGSSSAAVEVTSEMTSPSSSKKKGKKRAASTIEASSSAVTPSTKRSKANESGKAHASSDASSQPRTATTATRPPDSSTLPPPSPSATPSDDASATHAIASAHLVKLQQTMDRNFTAIQEWQEMMTEYPEKRDMFTQNIERVQDAIFETNREIKKEKRRLGMVE